MPSKAKLTKEQENSFKMWMEDGNVIQNPNGTYSTQDALYRNELKDMDALKEYFYNEFIKGQYGNYEGGGSTDDIFFAINETDWGYFNLSKKSTSYISKYDNEEILIEGIYYTFTSAFNDLFEYLNSKRGREIIRENENTTFTILQYDKNKQPRKGSYPHIWEQEVFSISSKKVIDLQDSNSFEKGGFIYAGGGSLDDIHLVAKAIEYVTGNAVDTNSIEIEENNIAFKYKKSQIATTISRKLIQDTISMHKKSLEMRGRFARGGNVPSIEKKVQEVNRLIELGNKNGISVVDSRSTWESPMKYKPIRYSNGVLYVEYEELDLYKYNRTGVSKWETKKDKILKRNMQFDSPLNDIARMYRKALKQEGVEFAEGGETKNPKKYVVKGYVYDGGEIWGKTFDNIDEAIGLAEEIQNGWTDDGTYYLITIYNEQGKKVTTISDSKYFTRLKDNKLFKKVDLGAETKKERQLENEKLRGYKFNLQVRIASYPDNLTIFDKTFDSIFDVMDEMNTYYEEDYYASINNKNLDYWQDKYSEIDGHRNYIKGKYGWSFVKEGDLWIAKDDYESNHIVRIENGKPVSNSSITKGALKQIMELEAQKKYSGKPKDNNTEYADGGEINYFTDKLTHYNQLKNHPLVESIEREYNRNYDPLDEDSNEFNYWLYLKEPYVFSADHKYWHQLMKPSKGELMSAFNELLPIIDKKDIEEFPFEYAGGGEAGFDDAGTSMVIYHETKGNWMVAKGQVYLWLYDVEDSAEKIENEEFDYVIYPYASQNMAWQKGFIPPLKKIWTKKYQKEHKGSEHLLGVIKAYLIDNDTKLYIDMMSVNPTKKKKGIMSYMIKELRDTFNIPKENVEFSQLTEEGKKFVDKGKYASGGGVKKKKLIFTTTNTKMGDL